MNIALSPEHSRAEFVYDALRLAIHDERLKPGERIREAEVAASLGVSRTPVREALRRLQVEGLLTVAGDRGLIVLEFTNRQIIELYRVREVLEGTAARLAANNAAHEEIAALHGLVEAFEANRGEPDSIIAINRQFHTVLFEASRNLYLLELLKQMQDRLALLRPIPRQLLSQPGLANEDHRRIVTAIERRDPDAAEAAAREHISRALMKQIEFSVNPTEA